MKRKLVNKKVVNSIGIGLLAAMTAATPIMAQAAEAEGGEVPEETNGNSAPAVISKEQKDAGQLQDGMNEIITEGVQEVVGETEESAGETIEVKAEEIEQDIKEDLKDSADKAGAVQENVSELNSQNKTVEDNNKIIEEIADGTGAGSLNQVAGTVSDAAKEAKAAETVTETSKGTAAGIADSIEKDAGTVYENSEAAQAAKEQAQTKLQEAENALTEAQTASEEATKKVELLATAVEVIETQKKEAEDALAAAEEARGKAEEALKKIQAEVQKGDSGFVYAGNAEAAIQAAEAALAKANQDVADAQGKAETLQQELDAKKNDLGTAQTNLKTAEDELKTAQGALETAKANLETAVKEYQEAAKKQSSAQDRYDSAVTDKQEKEDAFEKADRNNTACQEELKDAQDKFDLHTKNDSLMNDKETGIKKQQKAVLKKFDPGNKDGYGGDAYWEAADSLAQKLIEYKLREEGAEAESIDLSDFYTKKNHAERNYVAVTYKDENGDHVKYYDYTADKTTGDITVLEKEVESYKIASGADYTLLIYRQEDGTAEYKVKGPAGGKFDVKSVTFEDGCYKVTMKTHIALNGDYRPQFSNQGEDGRGLPVFKEGNSQEVINQYDTKKSELDGKLTVAKDAAQKAADGLQTATGNRDAAVDEFDAAWAEKKAADALVSEKGSAWTTADGRVQAEQANVTAREKDRNLFADAVTGLTSAIEKLLSDQSSAIGSVKKAEAVQIAVDNASTELKEAINNLTSLSAKTVSKEKYDEIVQTHTEALAQYAAAQLAKAGYEKNLAETEAAVARARAAAAADFRYNTDNGGETTDPGNGGGGTTGGGTGDGGETTPGGEGGTGTGEGGEGTTDPTAPAGVTTIPDTTIPLAPAAPGADGNGGGNGVIRTTARRGGAGTRIVRTAAGEEELTGEGEEEEIVTLAEEKVPLADETDDIEDTQEKETEEFTDIEEEEVPLAPAEQEQGKMSWWWLLIVAICGATGYEMYRRHQKKLEQEEASNSHR